MLSPLSITTDDGHDSDIHGQLYHLCKNNEIDRLKECLSFLGNINIINRIQTSTGSTCLHVACYYGHTDVVKVLLEHGAVHYIRNLRHDLTAFEETTNNTTRQLLLEHQNSSVHDDHNCIEWSLVEDDLMEKRREFRRKIDLYKTYDNQHLVSKLLIEVIHYYLNEHLINQTHEIDNSKEEEEDIRKKIETIEGYFKKAIEEQDYLTYFIKAYTSTNIFYKVLNKDLALYVLDYFETTKNFTCNHRLVNCLVHIVTLLSYHPNLPHYRYKGICFRGMRITHNDLDQYQVGRHILNRAFLSASMDREVAEMFAGVGQQPHMRYTSRNDCALQYSCVCQYLIKQNSTAIDVQSLSVRPDEKEVLILPFSVFKIIDIRRNDLNDHAAPISVEIDLEECEDPNSDQNEAGSTHADNQVSRSPSSSVDNGIKFKRQTRLLYGVIGFLVVLISLALMFTFVFIFAVKRGTTNNGSSIFESDEIRDYSLPSGKKRQ